VNFLKQLRRCMAPGGRLVIVTHNERSLLARLQGPGWAPYCPLHPQLYNPRSIAATLSQAGFRAVTVRRPVNYFPVMYLMRHLAFALGMGKLNLPEWPQLAVGLRLGNILTVAEPV
jgi:SAM-dependent methyltransferase